MVYNRLHRYEYLEYFSMWHIFIIALRYFLKMF